MTSEDDWVQRVLRSMVRKAVETSLRSQDYSTRHLARIDTKAIGQEIDRITDEITTRFVEKLKAKGYLGPGSNAPVVVAYAFKLQEEFASMFRATMDEYFVHFEPD
jgi:hypothetical protein